MTQIFSHDQVATLADLVDLWSTDRFVLIGATALACHIDMTWRATDDLDLNLLSTADDYPAGLDSRSGWSRASRSPHRALAAQRQHRCPPSQPAAPER